MKIKKISAIILAGALLASAVGMNAFADSTGTKPTITVFGNESSPAKPGETVELNVRLSNFSTIKGMDLILTLDGTAVAVNDVSGKIGETALAKDTNYTIKDGKIHIVELTAGNEVVNFKVNATVNKGVAASNYAIKLTKSELAISGTDMIKDENSINSKLGKVVVGTTSDTVKEGQTELAAENGYFIPYGSVYGTDKSFVKKDGNGKFAVSAGTTYQQFLIPEDITTFGVSDMFKASNGSTNRQFGTYANEYDGENYGTMLIFGDFNTAADYVREKSGMSVSELLNFLSTKFNERNIAADGKKYLPVTYKDGTETKELKVIKVAQTKYLWKSTDGKSCEYALRVIDITDSQTYTAVGYHGAKLSTEIKTEIYKK